MASTQKYVELPSPVPDQEEFSAPAPMTVAPPPRKVSLLRPFISGDEQPVIGQQPGGLIQIQWMPAPQTVAVGCPPGLEYLTHIDLLLVHQQIKPSEIFAETTSPNRYQIKNSLNQQVFLAHEDSDLFMRECCGSRRGFRIHITDYHNQEVLRLTREFKCCGGCCVAGEITVEAPVGNVIGYARQVKSWCFPNFTVLDSAKEPVLRIQGPIGISKEKKNHFMIMDESLETELGRLTKLPQGIPRTNVGDFGIKFPSDLSIDMKACLLGCLFLIEFLFFEHRKRSYHLEQD